MRGLKMVKCSPAGHKNNHNVLCGLKNRQIITDIWRIDSEKRTHNELGYGIFRVRSGLIFSSGLGSQVGSGPRLLGSGRVQIFRPEAIFIRQ